MHALPGSKLSIFTKIAIGISKTSDTYGTMFEIYNREMLGRICIHLFEDLWGFYEHLSSKSLII
jgi:hypothetical protein